MASFNAELPNELIKEFQELDLGATDMMEKMTRAGANVVFDEVKKNLPKAFKKTDNLEKALIITKTYRNAKEEIATKVGFYGYDTTRKTKQYPNGTPIPLIILAREYGSSSGEKKIPILRPAFRKNKAIESAMLKVQDSYLPKE